MARPDAHALNARKFAPLFAALGDPARLTMMTRLAVDGPLPTVQLGKRSGVSRQAITKHLQLLEKAGLLQSDRVGRHRQWRLRAEPFAGAQGFLDQIATQWDARVLRLRAFLEAESD